MRRRTRKSHSGLWLPSDCCASEVHGGGGGRCEQLALMKFVLLRLPLHWVSNLWELFQIQRSAAGAVELPTVQGNPRACHSKAPSGLPDTRRFWSVRRREIRAAGSSARRRQSVSSGQPDRQADRRKRLWFASRARAAIGSVAQSWDGSGDDDDGRNATSESWIRQRTRRAAGGRISPRN